MEDLFFNRDVMWIMISFAVLLVSQLLKLPIKAITKKFIANETVRSRVNVLIMLIPLVLGVIFEYFVSLYVFGTAFSVVEGVKIGGTSITLYGMLEKTLKGAKSETTVQTEQLVGNIVADGKIDITDKEIVDDFINKVQKQ